MTSQGKNSVVNVTNPNLAVLICRNSELFICIFEDVRLSIAYHYQDACKLQICA